MQSRITLAALAALAALVLAACAEPQGQGYRRINAPNPDDRLQAHIYELDNGLRVYLTANSQTPHIYAEIAVRAGSKHDPADATGLAHYLEHLLFKGDRQLGTLDYAAEEPHLRRIHELYEEHFRTEDPQRRAAIYAEINAESQRAARYAIPNELDNTYRSMGGTGLNAHTSYEETVYKVSLPANRLAQWVAIESARFVNPVFRLFHTELETVYEEKNRSLDSAGRIINYAASALLFKKHPYGQQPTIGKVEHLKNPSLAYIQQYFDTWYVPNNMAIIISGDIDMRETMELIAAEFGRWQARPLPQVGPWDEPPLQGAERAEVHYPGREQVLLGFRTVAASHADRDALRLVNMILDNSQAGLINLNLNQRQRVMGAGSSPLFLNDAGVQYLSGSPVEGQELAEVERLLLEQLQLVKDGRFDDWLMEAIVNDFKKSEKAVLESNRSRVARMRNAFLEYTDWDRRVGRIARMEQLGRDDIVQVANKYFGDDYVAVYRRNAQNDIPEVTKPHIDPVDIDPARQSDFARSILDMEYRPEQPVFVKEGEDYQLLEFAPGVQLYYASNPLNDLFSFSIYTEVGTHSHPLLGMAVSLLGLSGTADLDSDELQKTWYRLGGDFSMSTGDITTSIGISGLDEQFEPSLELMLEVINRPAAEAEVLPKLKERILKARADARLSPPAIFGALHRYNLWDDESPALEALTAADIQEAQQAHLLALPARVLEYRQSLFYTGSIPLPQLLAILRRHYQPAAELRDTPPPRMRRVREITGSEVLVVDKKTAQAQVRVAFADGLFDERNTVPAMVFNNYFGGGLSGVVFQELREARALAYSAGASWRGGGWPGFENLMSGSIGTQNDKTVEALTALIDLMDNMPQSQERFDNSIDNLVSRYRNGRTGFRSVSGAAWSWKRRGLDGDPGPQRFAALQQFRMDDLLRFQREHVAGRPKLISVMGDLSVIDIKELERFGTVRQVQPQQLFVD